MGGIPYRSLWQFQESTMMGWPFDDTWAYRLEYRQMIWTMVGYRFSWPGRPWSKSTPASAVPTSTDAFGFIATGLFTSKSRSISLPKISCCRVRVFGHSSRKCRPKMIWSCHLALRFQLPLAHFAIPGAQEVNSEPPDHKSSTFVLKPLTPNLCWALNAMKFSRSTGSPCFEPFPLEPFAMGHEPRPAW